MGEEEMRHHKGKINWKVRETEKKMRKGTQEGMKGTGERMSIGRKANEGNEDWDG